jgi:hypothetical protein
LGGRGVVTYFTSFNQPAIMEASDVDMIESILLTMDLSKGLCLIINSPGGDALGAERMVKVCRAYSRDDFVVMVPNSAKSAATMVALGARRILMPPTAELGPIDPQVPRRVGDRIRLLPADAIITSFEQLIKDATGLGPRARIEPYLQQLDLYDSAEIESLKKLRDLAADIAEQSLRTGMLKDDPPDRITKCIQLFTDWGKTLAHGRAIFAEAARDAGLDIEIIPLNSRLWAVAFELYLRTDSYVSTTAIKTVESARHEVVMTASE